MGAVLRVSLLCFLLVVLYGDAFTFTEPAVSANSVLDQGLVLPGGTPGGETDPKVPTGGDDKKDTDDKEQTDPETQKGGDSKGGDSKKDADEKEKTDPETQMGGDSKKGADEKKTDPETQKGGDGKKDTSDKEQTDPETQKGGDGKKDADEKEQTDPETQKGGDGKKDADEKEKTDPETQKGGDSKKDADEKEKTDPETQKGGDGKKDTDEKEQADPETQKGGDSKGGDSKKDADEKEKTDPETQKGGDSKKGADEKEKTDPETQKGGDGKKDADEKEKTDPETQKGGDGKKDADEKEQTDPDNDDNHEKSVEVKVEGVQQVFMFRAISSKDATHNVENNDLASLGGVVKYVITEVLPESTQAKTRQTRKYNIDVISKRMFKFKNPISTNCPETLAAGFQEFVTYDYGMSTNTKLSTLIQSCGDFVGVQRQRGEDYAEPDQDPHFWYSVGNYCPNKPWVELPNAEGQTTSPCTAENKCEAKGPKSEPNKDCLKYKDSDDFVMGGLCEGGVDNDNTVPTKDPTGQRGCVYTYGKSEDVNLDAISGILEEDCGGKKCKDWMDFRRNGDKTKYGKMFAQNEETQEVTIVDAKMDKGEPFAVEYDIHHLCRGPQGCFTEGCPWKEGKEYELGLPFWKGRCDAAANARRTAAFAKMFGVHQEEDEHITMNPSLTDQTAHPCRKIAGLDPNFCQPTTPDNAVSSGPFCTREFSGICSRCFIHGTTRPEDAEKDHPRCPTNILAVEEYAEFKEKIKCKSNKASEECCLYTQSCSQDTTVSGEEATPDADGFALVAYHCREEPSDCHMIDFLAHLARHNKKKIDTDSQAIKDMAFDAWGLDGGLKLATNFDSFQAKVLAAGVDDPDAKDDNPSTDDKTDGAGGDTEKTDDADKTDGGEKTDDADKTDDTDKTDDADTDANKKKNEGGGIQVWVWILIIVGVLAVAAIIKIFVFPGEGTLGPPQQGDDVELQRNV